MSLCLQDLAKIYPGGVRAVDELSLQVAAGELLVLMGPSGCGKTTTLRMIAGLEPPSGGSIVLAGRVLDGVAPRERDIAMVFQHGALYPHLSVRANLAFGLKLRRVAKAEIGRRVGAAAAALGIEELLERRPGQLSGGQRQRVALGRALVRQPKLFLFDEPLVNLDAGLRGQLQEEIRRLHTRLGATMVYVTHDQTEAMTLGERIAVLREGRMQQLSDPLTLYSRPANRFVAALIGSPPINVLAGRIEKGQGGAFFSTSGGAGLPDACGFALPIPGARKSALQSYADRPILLGVRPEHLSIFAAAQPPDGPRITAVVEAIERLGPVSHVFFRAGQERLISRMDAECRLRTDEQVTLSVAMDRVHFFDPQSEAAVE